MARLRPRRVGRVTYIELIWSGPDLDPATGKKARHSRSLGRRDQVSRDDANLALDTLRRELFFAEHGLAAPDTPTVDRWRQEYLAWHAAEFPSSHYRTRQILEQHIPAAWAHRRLGEITDQDVEDAKRAWRDAGFRDHTVAKHLRTVKAWLNLAVDKGILAASPAAVVKAPRILDSAPHLFYEAEDLEALYLASSFDPHHPEARSMRCGMPRRGSSWRTPASAAARR
jgi:hypothetical protein